MKSLAWKLGAALMLVAIISVAVMAVLVNQATHREFRSYIETNPAFADTISRTLAVVYMQNRGTWIGLGDVLPQFLIFEGDRLAVADISGTIIADTSGVLTGQTITGSGLTDGYPINTKGMGFQGGGSGGGQTIGQFFYISQSEALNSEQNFLGETNRWLWLSGGLALLLAIGLAVVLATNLIRPLKALNAGAQKIAAGKLGHRVEVKSKDETGRLAESFNVMANSLQKSEEARKRLLADVAHELRTPLTVIKGTVDAMIDGVLPTDESQLKIIRGESLVLARLISDLRDLSLAEAGKLKLELSVIDWADLINSKLNQLRPLAEAKGIGLEFKGADGSPRVFADWLRMEQVLANLLSNAIRHTPGGGKITVSLSGSNLDGKPAVTTAVSDTGEGIPADKLEHIFDRFYRIEDSRARSEGTGAGLGLAIVKQMMAAHGGEVRVESRPGEGSTFFITLPAAETLTQKSDPATPESSPKAS
jgi:two-component system, OmpR family, sensor histidine kinase BaeS